MKKFLALALSVLSIGFVASSAEAKTCSTSAATVVTANAAAPQIKIRIGGKRRRNRQVVKRVVVTRRNNGRRVVVRRRTVVRRRHN